MIGKLQPVVGYPIGKHVEGYGRVITWDRGVVICEKPDGTITRILPESQ